MGVIQLEWTVLYFLQLISTVLLGLLLNKMFRFDKALCFLGVFKILGYIL